MAKIKLSVTGYAAMAGISVQAVRKRLPDNFKKGITAEKIGSYWCISVPEDFKKADLLITKNRRGIGTRVKK